MKSSTKNTINSRNTRWKIIKDEKERGGRNHSSYYLIHLSNLVTLCNAIHPLWLIL